MPRTERKASEPAAGAPTATSRILDLLADGRVWRLCEISDRIGVHGATIIHLAERGMLVRVARGRYALRGLHDAEPGGERPPSRTQRTVLRLLSAPRSAGDLRMALGVSRQAVHRTLRQLLARGLVRRTDARRASRYQAVEPPADAA